MSLELSERVEVPLPPVQVSNTRDLRAIESLTLPESQQLEGRVHFII